jgi:arylsulfatase A-like enzyme
MESKPNVVFVFPDQMRRCAAGFGGELSITTPVMDRLARESLDFTHAISGMPVCCPARASLMTGRYAHHHGVIINDVHLDDAIPSLGRTFASAGYTTGYVGKWHLNANGRKAPVPPASQHGFQFWKALECTHDYNASDYYEGASTAMKRWPGYDAFAQTDEAIGFVEANARQERPFLLFLSWGPPHDPYETAPEEFRRRVRPEDIRLRPNVPLEKQDVARRELAGYHAHILALDHALGRLLDAVDRAGVAEDTIFVFWSDHGDMLHSHGERRKQRPWEESVHVPLLIRHPRRFGRTGRRIEAPINTPDLMPTLLGLCGLPIPSGVDGTDYTAYLEGRAEPPASAALLACYAPFGEFLREEGGREYRGVRTTRYTYAESLAGPWLLYDDHLDPYQMRNLVHDPAHQQTRRELQGLMRSLLAKTGDAFEPADAYIRRFKHTVDHTGTAPYPDFF